MPRRVITREFYDRVFAEYRKTPGAHSAVANRAKTDARTCRRLWEDGIKTRGLDPEMAKPMSVAIQEEQERAHALFASEQAVAIRAQAEAEARQRREIREKGEEDRAKERAEDASLVRLAKADCMMLLQTIAQTSKSLAKLGASIGATAAQYTALDPATGQPRALLPNELRTAVSLVSTFTAATKTVVDATQRVIEMERLILGEPTSIVQHQDVSPAVVYARMERVAHLLARARARGIELVVDADAEVNMPPLALVKEN